MKEKKEIQKVIEAIKRHDDFLVTSHINPEGDSIGSQLSMAFLLKRLGKKYMILDHDPMPDIFDFMLSGEKIRTSPGSKKNPAAVIAVDCPSIERAGSVSGYLKGPWPVINIDHHVSNTRFGLLNWIEPDVSSCGEMIFHLYKAMGVPLTKKEAIAMYVAIVTDTGSFSYENTTSMTHSVVCELVNTGVVPLWVSKQLNEKRSPGDLILLSKTLGTLELHFNDKVSTIYTSKDMLNSLKLSTESVEGFVNYARSIKTVKVAVFFLERPDRPGDIQISFRSKGEVDVNKLAQLFGGGGHPNASGCTVKGSIPDVKKAVLRKVRSLI